MSEGNGVLFHCNHYKGQKSHGGCSGFSSLVRHLACAVSGSERDLCTHPLFDPVIIELVSTSMSLCVCVCLKQLTH